MGQKYENWFTVQIFMDPIVEIKQTFIYSMAYLKQMGATLFGVCAMMLIWLRSPYQVLSRNLKLLFFSVFPKLRPFVECSTMLRITTYQTNVQTRDM